MITVTYLSPRLAVLVGADTDATADTTAGRARLPPLDSNLFTLPILFVLDIRHSAVTTALRAPVTVPA